MNLTHNVSWKYYLFAWAIQSIVNLAIGLARFVSGWEMDGQRRTDAGWITTGTKAVKADDLNLPWWYFRPRAVRALIRLGVTAVVVVLAVAMIRDAETTMRLAMVVGAVTVTAVIHRAIKTREKRRFDRYYVKPTAATLAAYLGWPSSTPWQRWFNISPDLQGLAPPPSKPLSPAERWVREWYGVHIEPKLMWLPNQFQRLSDYWNEETPKPAAVADDGEAAPDERTRGRRAADQAKDRIQTVFGWFVRPDEEDEGPRIEIKAAPGLFVTAEIKAMINEVLGEKLRPQNDLTPRWDQRGDTSVGVWTAVLEPPKRVSYDGIIKIIDALAEHEIYIGKNKNNEPVIISLDSDSPHLALSAGTGAGKSILAMIVAIQVLRRGGKVKIIDFKMTSHPWAVNLPGVEYVWKIEDIHDLLIKIEREAALRNEEAMRQNPFFQDADANPDEYDAYDVGPRILTIFEEMNATIDKLIAYWATIRTPSDPKTSPAVVAFRNLMYMGRGSKNNMMGIAQMLTARTTGGPEARENFGTRMLARFTRNNWRMMVPECAMPRRKSKVRGRWQVVVEGEVTEVQVPFTEDLREVRRIAVPARVPAQPTSGQVDRDQVRPGSNPGRVPVGADDLPPLADGSDPLAELVTLREGIEQGLVVAPSYDAARKRIIRAQKGESEDEPIWPSEETRGSANLFKKGDLIAFFTQVPTSERAEQNR